jgi:NADH:ubiquinone oxidoreductase subunit 6 (subunit J)
LNAAGLLVLLGLDFFAMVFLVIYIGAITTLFLFVVMMLNIKLAEINEKKLRYLPVGALIGILFLIEILGIIDLELVPDLGFLMGTLPGPLVDLSGAPLQVTLHEMEENMRFTLWSNLVSTVTNIEAVGRVIYTYYFYFFIIASLILLVAMIGSIILTLYKGAVVKRQDAFLQNTREFAKTVQKTL